MLDFLDTDPGWLHKYAAMLLLLLMLLILLLLLLMLLMLLLLLLLLPLACFVARRAKHFSR